MQELQSVIPKDQNDLIDAIENRMLNEMVASGEFEIRPCPLKHTFTDGMYSRQITMEQGMRITSKIHRTEHQFVISQGCAIVYENGEEMLLEAPYIGVTKKGTRRVLMIPEDADEACIWTTFHANPNNETLEEIENRIIEKHDNPLLTSENKKQVTNEQY